MVPPTYTKPNNYNYVVRTWRDTSHSIMQVLPYYKRWVAAFDRSAEVSYLQAPRSAVSSCGVRRPNVRDCHIDDAQHVSGKNMPYQNTVSSYLMNLGNLTYTPKYTVIAALQDFLYLTDNSGCYLFTVIISNDKSSLVRMTPTRKLIPVRMWTEYTTTVVHW